MHEIELSPALARVGARIGAWTLNARIGAGAASVVFAATRADGVRSAFKVARAEWLGHEIELVALTGRRWGPALLDCGELGDARWMATTWTDGEPLDVAAVADRRRLAAIVAHGIGRGLAELHRLGVRHGDVKPANILLGRSVPKVDRAADRGATLVDLDLATHVDEAMLGGTPRYLAPELRSAAASPAADLYALGVVLAEILLPELADEAHVEHARIQRALRVEPEIATWIEALLAPAPGSRASAGWLAGRAARLLALDVDGAEVIEDRRTNVRRAYVAARARALPRHVGGTVDGPARAWLEELRRIGPVVEEPLDELGKARWIVGLVGPAAASWPVPSEPEGILATRLLTLAERAPPEAWTRAEIAGRDPMLTARSTRFIPTGEAERWVSLTRALAAPSPADDVLAVAEEASAAAPSGFVVQLAGALLRRGDVGRAHAAIARAGDDAEARLLRAEIARRRGEVEVAEHEARAVAGQPSDRAAEDVARHPSDRVPVTSGAAAFDEVLRDGARALLARLAWDAGDLLRSERELGDASGPAAAEVRALVAYARGEYEQGLLALAGAASQSDGGLGLARLEGTRGMLEHARGRSGESRDAFARAVELAERAGAVVEEATYLTGLAAAAVDAGAASIALAAALRGALLWERLDRPALAARAHLSRAAAFALVGAAHDADRAAEETLREAARSLDERAAAYARWAIVETRPFGDSHAREECLRADRAASSDEDRIRSKARLLLWAPDVVANVASDDARVRTLSATARWEWWGARAASALAEATGASARTEAGRIVGEIVALLAVPAPIGARGPALAAGVRLAREIGDGEAARRFAVARAAAAAIVREGCPVEYRAALGSVAWLEGGDEAEARTALGSAQVGELEAIVRALSSRDRLKPLLEQVVDTMVLWTGVERGLLLLRAPDDRLVPRAARNLARQDLAGEQIALSTGLARRAMAERQAICATDAFAQVGDLHASVHALGLRSVLAVPLIARGDVLGVVYLDDRVRRGAFGPSELAWVRLVASQAALAIADARDATLLRRAVRKAERARARLAEELGAREVELASVRAELASSARLETRFAYDEIAGRSEPMRALLRLVDRVTASEVPVLLSGESGTGKELVARAIHRNGPRGGKAFVSENCASVPETLLESTLFGHVRGAFTGASATRAGLFDVADGGTLFLDEIGEMSLTMQTKLLRVLQDGEVRAVGGERARHVDVRIIAATHRDLEAMVTAGTFREDPLLSAQRRRCSRPSASRAPRRHPSHREPLPRKIRQRAQDSRHARGDGETRFVPLAGQRSAARERDAPRPRSCRRPDRRR